MSISGAGVSFTLTIPPLFQVPQQLQGFAVDDVYDIPQIKSVEVLMGVDGILSGGFVYKEITQEIMLQADSASNAVFDIWWTQMVAAKDVYVASGLIRVPSIATKFIHSVGYLTDYKLPGVKRLVQPRRYGITWQMIAPQPG